MSHGGDAADQMMRQTLELSESAVKLAGLGAKNLAALCLALANENQKLAGKTKMNTLLRSGKELSVIGLKEEDLPQFKQLAERYGVLFSAIKESLDEKGGLDVLTYAEDVSKVNRIFDKMGYGQTREEDNPKKNDPRPQSKMPSREDETSSRHGEDMDTTTRKSVVFKMKQIKLKQEIPMESFVPRKEHTRWNEQQIF